MACRKGVFELADLFSQGLVLLGLGLEIKVIGLGGEFVKEGVDEGLGLVGCRFQVGEDLGEVDRDGVVF